MLEDKNGITLQVNDMVKYKENRYKTVLATVESITPSNLLWVEVCGSGGRGHRLLQSTDCEKVINSENYQVIIW
jgi:hypothetical protein